MKDASGYRKYYQDISGSVDITTATGDTTLVNCKDYHTIYIQRAIVYVDTDAAQSLSLEDSATPARKVGEVTTSPGDETRWDFDYGDVGMPLTQGQNFICNVSAAGLGAQVVWEGYMKLSVVTAADNL